VVVLLAAAATSSAADPDRQLEGDDAGSKQPVIQPNPLVEELLNDELTGEAERRRMSWFHGRWDRLSEPTATEAAHIALMAGDWGADALHDPGVDPRLRAEAALLRGELNKAIELLDGDASVQADLLRARAWVMLGQMDRAVRTLDRWREMMRRETLTNPAELTAAAEAMFMLAALEGRPAGEYQTAVSLLGRAHGELDRLYWPALVAEAEALYARGSRKEASEAAIEALALNPNAAGAWRVLGRLSYTSYNFDKARAAVEALRGFAPDHPYAAMLEAGSYLQQRDAESAQETLAPALERFPRQPQLVALRAAAWALRYDMKQAEQTLRAFDEIAPGSELGPLTVGRFLSRARQYEPAERMLRRAIERQPNSAEATTELGLLLMQAGLLEPARAALARATQLDPFHVRAANSLQLVEDMLGWETIETEHFVIRYQPGVDAVLARDMPEIMERIHDDLVAFFQFEPEVKTQIDLMPNEKFFGVRITGMPDIWTIAAATGPVVAMTPPRAGAKQRGDFHWTNVLRHEYVHTVTLGQTHNRIPHWFTEACAVLQEENPRPYASARLLAQAFFADKLFPLSEINWGFVRPKTPQDRPLAYAQSAWMLEYLIQTHGRDAMIELLGLFRQGVSDTRGIERVTGEPAEVFMENFKQWARSQVERWGLAPHPHDEQVNNMLETLKPGQTQLLTSLLMQYPTHPGLLLRAARIAMAGDDKEAARAAVVRYAMARPIDPWADRALVKLAVETGDAAEAIGALQRLDRRDGGDGDWAAQLAAIHRDAGRLDEAANAAERALSFQPYDAKRRETAATIQLQRGDTQRALHHLKAMPLLEPEQAVHHVRLAAVYHRLGNEEQAAAAARAALALDPKAPVQKFLAAESTR